MFSTINFEWPASLHTVNSSAANKLTNATGQLTDAKSRLQSVPAMTVVNNPVAASCAGSMNELESLHTLLVANVATFCVHPWVQGVGQGESHNRYLSPANAITAAANKFVDSVDTNKPKTVVDAVCVLLTATSYSMFAETLKRFCIVFPDAQLNLCQRRALQLATVEKEKTILPDAAGNAVWRPSAIPAFGRTQLGCQLAGERLAHAVGYEAGGMAADNELIALANKKAQQLTAIKTAIDSFSASFSDAVGRGVFIAAKTPEQIKNQLLAHSLGHDEPLACCVIYTGAPGSLNLLREMLGL